MVLAGNSFYLELTIMNRLFLKGLRRDSYYTDDPDKCNVLNVSIETSKILPDLVKSKSIQYNYEISVLEF